MNFRVVEIKSASKVRVKAAQATVMVPSSPFIEMKEDEIGFLEGKFSDHQRGIFMQGGIIDPGWSGYLTIEFLIFGECSFDVGQEIAHAIILKK